MASRPEAAYAAAEVTPKWVLISWHHLLSPSRIVAYRPAACLLIGCRPYTEPEGMYERILVALDGSEDAEQVLPNVQALAEKFGSEVVVLRATVASEEVLTATTPGTALGDVPIVDPTPIVEAEEDVALRYLHEVSARL